MEKITEKTITFTGKSGKEYTFSIYKMDTEFDAIGGIYIFTNRHIENGKYVHAPIYCGKTGDLSERFDNHHKADCIKKNKANCLCFMRVDLETRRTEIETDILKGNDFICNEVLN